MIQRIREYFEREFDQEQIPTSTGSYVFMDKCSEGTRVK